MIIDQQSLNNNLCIQAPSLQADSSTRVSKCGPVAAAGAAAAAARAARAQAAQARTFAYN
jgi:hypothetical protein